MDPKKMACSIVERKCCVGVLKSTNPIRYPVSVIEETSHLLETRMLDLAKIKLAG
jgi:hypothetical protein